MQLCIAWEAALVHVEQAVVSWLHAPACLVTNQLNSRLFHMPGSMCSTARLHPVRAGGHLSSHLPPSSGEPQTQEGQEAP
jgi:hypothetical protein